MATLLCSLLIGNRYAAMVVSGYASREITNNDQRRVSCPNVPCSSAEALLKQPASDSKLTKTINKYTLPEPLDFQSKYLIEVEARKQKKLAEQEQEKINRQLEELRILERLADDEHHGKRRHAWVVVLSNVDWAAKKSADPEHRFSSENDIQPFFIEPSTGVHFSADDSNYFTVESVWNDSNYYVNCQDAEHIAAINWNVQDAEYWGVLITDEAIDSFVKRSETPDQLKAANIINTGKYLDMPNSWVKRLNISNSEYDERYPNGRKLIHYKRATLEVFAPYMNDSGVIKRLVVYHDLDYQSEKIRWQFYQNREDLLETLEKDSETNQIIETYASGRSDYLKCFTKTLDEDARKTFEYYENSRLDGLLKLEVSSKYIREHFEYREGRFLYFREFERDGKSDSKLLKVVEKFHRNEDKLFHEDILERTFDIANGKMTIQFHYGDDEITPTIRVYKCPPKPEYGCEIVFDEIDNPVDMTNKYEKNVSKLKRYQVLLEQLRDQEKCVQLYNRRLLDIESTMVQHQNNAEHPILTFSIYDPLRNSAARSRRMAKKDQMEKEKALAMTSTPDALAPYLVQFQSKPSAVESDEIREKCLNDIQSDYTERLDYLQQQYENVCKEAESLKKFLGTVHDKLDRGEYEQFLKQGHQLDVSRRVFQQHIIDTEQEFETKYNETMENLQHDIRLTTAEN